MSTLEEDLAINRTKLEVVKNEITRIEAELNKLPLVQEWRRMLQQKELLEREIFHAETDKIDFTNFSAPMAWVDGPSWDRDDEDEVNV